MITWNGVTSDSIGVIVERIPNRYIPARRFSPQAVAGRNGNLLLVDKTFPNVEQEYEAFKALNSKSFDSAASLHYALETTLKFTDTTLDKNGKEVKDMSSLYAQHKDLNEMLQNCRGYDINDISIKNSL